MTAFWLCTGSPRGSLPEWLLVSARRWTFCLLFANPATVAIAIAGFELVESESSSADLWLLKSINFAYLLCFSNRLNGIFGLRIL